MTKVTNLNEYKEQTAAERLQEELSLFDFNGHEIETVVIKDENGKDLPLFRGLQVADILGYKNSKTSLAEHCKSYKKLSYLDLGKIMEGQSIRHSNENKASKPIFQQLLESGWEHNQLVSKKLWIPESDLYRLVMRSNKPNAKEFQNWVVETVLPTLRKDGMYVMGEEKVATGELSEDEFILRAMSLLQDKVDRLKKENENLHNKVVVVKKANGDIVDQFITDRMTAPQFCKQLNGVNCSAIQKYLQEKKILFKQGSNWKVYGSYRDTFFTERESRVEGTNYKVTRCFLTKKGARYIYKKYLQGELPMKKDWDGEFRSDNLSEEVLTSIKKAI